MGPILPLVQQPPGMQAVGYRLHGRVVKGVGHLGHDEAMEVESSIPDRGTIVGRVFSPTRKLVRFSHLNVPFFLNSEFIWNNAPVGKQQLKAICAFPL